MSPQNLIITNTGLKWRCVKYELLSLNLFCLLAAPGLLLLRTRAFFSCCECSGGFSDCGAQALGMRAQLWRKGLAAPWQTGFSRTSYRTPELLGRFQRWTIREGSFFLNGIRKVIISLRTFSDVWVTIPSILPLDTGIYFTFLHSFIFISSIWPNWWKGQPAV